MRIFGSKQKLLGLLLAAALTVGAVPATAYAQAGGTATDTSKGRASSAVEVKVIDTRTWDHNFYMALKNGYPELFDGDNLLKEKAERITQMEVNGKGIKDLSEIGNFPALKDLECGDNALTSLDTSGCPNLGRLYCPNNELASLNVSGCPALETLDCQHNSLASLDVSNCPKLELLIASDNLLTALDVSSCPELNRLSCYSNALTSINVSGCSALRIMAVSDNQLTSLEMTGCDSLGSLAINRNAITALDLSGCPSLERLQCEENQLDTLDLTCCPQIRWVDCYGNAMTSLNVTGCPALEKLECYKNALTSLDVSHCPKLYGLDCRYNALSSLDVSGNPLLEDLNCGENALTSLNVSGCSVLRQLLIQQNELTSLDVTGCPLTMLYCWQNMMPDQSAVIGFTGSWDGVWSESGGWIEPVEARFVFESQKVNTSTTPVDPSNPSGGNTGDNAGDNSGSTGDKGDITIGDSGSTGDNSGSTGGDSGSTGGDSSSDRSDRSSSTSTPSASATVSKEAAVSAVNRALSAAKANGSGTAVAWLKDPKRISLDNLRAMADKAGSMPLKVNADSMRGNAVDVRLSFNPAQATAALDLSGSTHNSDALKTANIFKKYYANKLMVVALRQKGSFGMPVEIAARLSPTLDTANLRFYSYDAATNNYRQIASPAHWIDHNGYIHFTTRLAGHILISEGELVKA